MINCEQTISEMPAKLKAFKKYIEKYNCTYCARGNVHTLYFYKEHENHYRPYIIVAYTPGDPHTVIYVNYKLDDLSVEDAPIHRENFVTNDMKKFLEAIRECA